MLSEQSLREVSRLNCPPSKEPTIQFADSFPRASGTRELHKDANRLVSVGGNWIDDVHENSYYYAIFTAFVAYKQGASATHIMSIA